MFDEFKENGGFGRALDMDKGYFNSWHHSLFYSFFMRLKFSRRRTLSPEEADLFIVPYDFTIHEQYTHTYSTEKNQNNSPRVCPMHGRRARCPAKSVKLRAFLQESQYFERRRGVDHVLIFSLTSPFYDCAKIKKRICQQCMGTSYFSYPPVLETKPGKYEERDMSSFVSVPFPSYYHWHDDVKELPWAESRIALRTTFSTFAGNTKVMIPDHSKLRRMLVQQCNRHPEHCLVVDMQTQKKSNISKVDITSTRAQIMDVEPADKTLIMKKYAQSVFCFVPPGDDPTRKGIVDVIIAGCIPVLFHPLTLHSQYPFHLSAKTAAAVSVYIPHGMISRKIPNKEQLDVVKLLRTIPSEVVREKQRQLALLAPKMMYAAPPLPLLRGLSELDSHTDATQRWDPPFADAASLALDGMFSRAERLQEGKTAMVPELNMSWPQWMATYNTTLL